MDFVGKKVVIMGLGQYKEGSGISAAKFFISRGAGVLITDLKKASELKAQIKELNKFVKSYKLQATSRVVKQKLYYPASYKLALGRHRISDFKNADIVVQNPGVRRDSPYLLAARKAGAQIVSDISIFLSLAPTENIISITGTRGKSTTAALVHAMLKEKDKHAELGGNIARSPFTFLEKLHEDAPVTLELSSWQCESLEEIKKSTHVAVITNILRDHLNTYKGMKEYAAAKSLIYKFQSPEDFVVLNRDNVWTRKMGDEVSSQRFWFSVKPFTEENGCFLEGDKIMFRRAGRVLKVAARSDIYLPGSHNVSNILAAVCAAKISGVSNLLIKKSLQNFKGLPGRMELVDLKRDVKFVNDTTATTPDATIAALKTLSSLNSHLSTQKKIVLICGGSDKKLEYKELASAVKKYVKAVVLLPGTATIKIKKVLKVPYEEVKNMKEAVRLATRKAKKGDIVLLSPAAASFGLFQNEFDRGEQFLKAVKASR